MIINVDNQKCILPFRIPSNTSSVNRSTI